MDGWDKRERGREREKDVGDSQCFPLKNSKMCNGMVWYGMNFRIYIYVLSIVKNVHSIYRQDNVNADAMLPSHMLAHMVCMYLIN